MKCIRENVVTIIATLAILICAGFLINIRFGPDHDTEKIAPESMPNSATIPTVDSKRVSHVSAGMADNEQSQASALRDTSERALFQQLTIANAMRIRRGNLDRTYAPLIAQLKMTSHEIELFKDLLAELKTANEIAELQEGSFKQDLRTHETVKSLEARNQKEILGSIANLLGMERFEAFAYYENTLPQRTEVEKIERMFSYQAEPLTSEQKELLIDIFHDQALLREQEQNAKQQVGKNPKTLLGKKTKQPADMRSKAAILQQAKPFLTASQLDALQAHLDSKQ